MSSFSPTWYSAFVWLHTQLKAFELKSEMATPQADLTAAPTSFFLDVSLNQARSGIHFAVQVLWHP